MQGGIWVRNVFGICKGRQGFRIAIDDLLGFGHDELGYSSLTASSCLVVVDCYI